MNRWRLELRYLLGNAPWDRGVSPPELLAFLSANPAGMALDIGCGTGTNLATLAEYNWQAWGVDLAQIAVWKARSRLARRHLSAHVFRGDITQELQFPVMFDMALDLGCSHALASRDRTAYADNLNRWIRPGGTVLVYSFYQPIDDPGIRWLSLKDVLATFEPAFEITRIEKGEFRGRASAWLTLEKRGA
jgi:SAM-dependent methyltransferase